MADYGRGAKAGAVGGIVYGVISTILALAVISVLVPGFWTRIGMVSATGMVIGAFAVTNIVGGLIGGLIFGLIYAAVRGSLPGGSSVAKAMVLAIIFWLIFGLGLSFNYISTLAAASGAAAGGYVLVGLASSLIYGALLGKLWESFG